MHFVRSPRKQPSLLFETAIIVPRLMSIQSNNSMENVAKLESRLSLQKRAREEDKDDDTASSTTTDVSFSEDDSDESVNTAFQAYYNLKAMYALNGSVSNNKISLLERLRDVASHNNLPLLTSTDLTGKRAIKRQRSETSLLRRKTIKTLAVSHLNDSPSPFQCLKDMFTELGADMATKSYESHSDWMPWNMEGYTAELTTSIRENDVQTVRRLKEKGQNLQCSNKFGESVVHTAARRGSYDVLEYFIQEAEVSIQVCCDSGRNPLHDSCWTGQPQFDCVRLLLENCPELLLFTDKRGFTPLEYVPKDTYHLWSGFLKRNRHLLPLPR